MAIGCDGDDDGDGNGDGDGDGRIVAAWLILWFYFPEQLKGDGDEDSPNHAQNCFS